MTSFSSKRFFKHLFIGIAISLVFSIFESNRSPMIRLVDGLFVGGLFPFCLGGLRLSKNLGTFDLFVYSHRKIWRSSKKKQEEENEKIAPGTIEKLGSYADYLSEKTPGRSAKEPFAAGVLMLLLSLILTFFAF